MKTTKPYYLFPLMCAMVSACGGHGDTEGANNDYVYAADEETMSGEAEYVTDPFNTEEYEYLPENDFLLTLNKPLSTFSIDVDNASYTNMRRFINNGSLPPADAIRIEEMVNYFDYDYPNPSEYVPFNIISELASCPWNSDNLLMHIGLQGYDVATEDLPASNLVFLVDVSGSMEQENKLPLLKQSLILLIDKLSEQDNIAIVVYAGNSGVVLESTPCNQQKAILNALQKLQAGGSTNGAAGIELAYQIAQENFKSEGNNRVILATDGDFNVGPSSDGELTRIIEEKRETGIYLTVLGFGMGNYKDSKMESIADQGNGNYFYIDELAEAHHVLVDNLAGTLLAIAKDVKIQVEFNPAHVESYRLIGYENRLLNDQDFTDDKKDAGELGAGHTVTALYELTLAGESDPIDLKYQEAVLKEAATTDELCTIKFRYKPVTSDTSLELTHLVYNKGVALEATSDNFRWAAAVASFGMILRDSKYKGDADLNFVSELARSAQGDDENGERVEFLELVQDAIYLTGVNSIVEAYE